MVRPKWRPVRPARAIGWLAVAAMLALAAIGPSSSPVLGAGTFGAIWTSLADGTTVNANIYASKSDVYLNGGPQNCGNGNGLPDGAYYFQVTDPSGATLLSSDAIRFREVKVADGVIDGVSGDGNHAVGTSGCNGGLPVRLMPYDDTPNNGGEYSVDLASKADVEACPGFSADSTSFSFLDCTNSKNDNFKVRLSVPAIAIVKVADPTALPFGGGDVVYTYTVTNPGDTSLSNVTVVDDTCAPVTYVGGDADGDEKLDLDETWTFTCAATIDATTTNTAVASGWAGETEVTDQDIATVTVAPPTPSPGVTPTAFVPTASPIVSASPVVTPGPTPGQSVLAETATPATTLPPTSTVPGSGGTPEGWRLALVAMAVLLAGVLTLTPVTAGSRRR